MKNTTSAPFHALRIVVLMAVAPLVGAQTPAAQPAPPGGTASAPAPAAAQAPAPPSAPAEDPSYLIGLTFGEQLHGAGIGSQVDQGAIARGLKEGLKGTKSTRAEQQQIQAFVQKAMAENVARNKQEAKDFLAKNGQEKGIKTTADGLQYKVLSAGDAKAPPVQPTDEVTVQYRGKLIDGNEFDSSYSRGTPTTFKLNGVIKGWQEGLALMKPGAKYQLFIPPELAYDNSPRPGIPPGSLLIFDVELLSAKPAEAPAASAAASGPKMLNPRKTATPKPADATGPGTP